MIWQIICGILLIIVIILIIRLVLLRRAFDEIADDVKERSSGETSTPITLTTSDRKARHAAVVLNEELKTLHDERCRYEAANSEINNAVTNISHDLRTPLTAINSYLDRIDSETDPDTRDMYLDRIRNRTDVMVGLTNELFKYSVSNVSKPAPREESSAVCDIKTVTAECMLSFYESFKKRGITPKIFLPEKGVMAKVTPSDADRILENIISNGLKYADSDFNVVLDDKGTVTFTNYAKDLTQVDVQRLFDRFYTVKNSAVSTGLGLSIAKKLISENGGTINASLSDENVLSITVCFREPEVVT
ncbi:MAG: HAMP domain-containing histidine kinase [Clostridiales bacterium]|nr:HAMP domain-containing histidine kinase [Clostridiales bacterium]